MIADFFSVWTKVGEYLNNAKVRFHTDSVLSHNKCVIHTFNASNRHFCGR